MENVIIIFNERHAYGESNSHIQCSDLTDPVPTKRICLQSHAAIELILCSYNPFFLQFYPTLYIISHLFAFLHTERFLPKVEKLRENEHAAFSNFQYISPK